MKRQTAHLESRGPRKSPTEREDGDRRTLEQGGRAGTKRNPSERRDSEDERGFQFLKTNPRQPKPRTHGVTEIRGPYYTVMGRRYLEDVLETMGPYVDNLKYAGGSFSLMPRKVVHELNDLCHAHEVQVSTGGFIEYVLTQGAAAVSAYLRECQQLGFDIVEISAGFITLSTDDWLQLIDAVHQAGMKPKPEVGIQFGAGGATAVAELEA